LHSGGKDWGKTEVDYTFRKHVKKIKNSQEVSYTQSKSLSVAVEDERLRAIISRSD
jgi:predicted ribosome quality control (RQC) complex YloA/Tae2 family protein